MASPTVIPNLESLSDFVGIEFEDSDWITVGQDRIDAFARATDDDQWIHTDVERARRESPWKETIAHGYLTLSLAPVLLRQILVIQGSTSAINAGIEKMRLSSPVLAGSRVRLRARIKHTRELPRSGVRVVFELRFEVEGSAKPACTADVVYLYFP
jgi:acyl dehydratase